MTDEKPRVKTGTIELLKALDVEILKLISKIGDDSQTVERLQDLVDIRCKLLEAYKG